MIKINVKNYTYNNKIPVLKNINLVLQQGSITCLIGASGCGKSTFLRLLMGMEYGAEGFIEYQKNNLEFSNWNSSQTLFAMVPQIPHLLPWKNIIENIILAIPKEKVVREKTSAFDIAFAALKIVQLETHFKKYPFEISLGMAQRVSLARSLVMDTQGILLDEPFASLDAYTRLVLQNWLKQKIAEANKYAILVTHDIHEAFNISQEIHVLSGYPAEITKTYQSPDKNLFIQYENEILNLLGGDCVS
jgi:ABC-type nitrate/sulfonate/bicarbonate transport system ATPase subunit